jgi:uncharacterized protein YacL
MSAGVGVLLAAVILVAEARLQWAAMSGLLGGVLGIFAAVLVTLILSRIAEPEPTKSFLECAVLAVFAYLGLVLGSKKAGKLHLETIRVGVVPKAASAAPESLKLLDTRLPGTRCRSL